MIKQLQWYLAKWLGIQGIMQQIEIQKQEYRESDIDFQEQIKIISDRLDELEKAYAVDPRRQKPAEPEPQIAPGFIPFSRRKKAWERANQSDGLNPTGRAILANEAAAKEKSKP